MSPEQFSSAVLEWYDRNGRHDLPWQQGITPYRVWVSEIMLQQTQVSTVLNYFSRFMEALPTVQALAEAPEDEVLHLWTGLGYYTRARNLQKTAKIVVEQYGGEFPRDVEKLTDLPGIGLSTAGAIASISMGLRAPILDGNVKRVLARYTAQQGYPGEPKVAKALWANAERYTPHSRVNHYTQAMMDLGATLCTRSKPSCLLCPLKISCEAHMLGEEIRFPVPKPRKELPQKRTLMPLLANRDGAILLYRRPSSGLWGGLWSLPELDNLEQLEDLAYQHGLNLASSQALDSLTHTFSHFQLAIEPWLVRVEAATDHVAEADWLWYNLATPPRLGLAAPVKKLLKRAADVLLTGESR
ncbi:MULTISPECIES: A/G-specific adenine glycosylase [Pseudomonas]|jgi:A/G-specific adenine glycosylase|uniref:Adenine DNA glycosylase n=1 Tax=Pseudomonas sp. Hg7Tf TaxID=3236988 RepID=A0AB39I1J9_9PSED|nr:MULTISPECIES: A/G-specific adenine glycosylase [Pseudomonas]KJK09415.1 adenine glycosylase [Pseudomonas sp. 5]MDD1976478.1 A/G-specific adenine glycosylase [Pseudomonas putida]MDH2560898.1 A/G-specific adenine glycosylase [Pseudomonas sp. Hg5Tf]QYX46726.1 A/G-specific adenine glycosylase [Pseudomonas sp. S11A 273]